MRTSLISGPTALVPGALVPGALVPGAFLFGVLAFGALVLTATSANAADQPPLTPTRDVAVTYQAKDPQGTVRVVHMNFDATGRRLHIDVVGQPGFVVIDRKDNTQLAVNYPAKSYIERQLPPEAGNLMDRDPNMHMTRGATATVAGISCTDWSMSTGPNRPDLVACITADGVVLKAAPAGGANGGTPNLEATQVAYGPQPDSLFVPPTGFQRIEPGAIPGLAPGAPPGAPHGAAPAPAKP